MIKTVIVYEDEFLICAVKPAGIPTQPDKTGDMDMVTVLNNYLKEKNIPIEKNLLGLWTHRNYTSKRFLSIAQKVGNSAILGIDAHSPEQLLNTSAEKLGISLCQEFGLHLLEEMGF